MDATTLRLILIGLGALLILGIYLWERLQRPPPEGAPSDVDTESHKALGQHPMERKVRSTDRPLDPDEEDPFPAPAVVDQDYFSDAEMALPTLILQINIVPKEGIFEGMDILRAVRAVDLRADDLQIFHRQDASVPKNCILFSMASMVEPGIFPLKSMHIFKTPGLTLFAQLPGPRDGLTVFSDMLFSAERMASELGGELQDESHSRLTKQTIEHIRSQIAEHRRRVQIAKSKMR